MAAAIHDALAAVWRIDGARIVGSVARLVRDVPLAEELAQEAMVAALERWPQDGLPDRPGAWLMTTARNRALDWLRHRQMQARKLDELGRDLEAQEALIVPDFSEALDAAREDEIGDDLLRLIFTACHPVLPTEGRVALTLKLLGGLRTAEIARAFLVPEPTMAQRIVRAKQKLRDARGPFEAPRGPDRSARLDSVLEVVYLVFNEGYTASAGADWMRPELAQEALRLARMLAGLMPEAAEAHGLAALLELQSSRMNARLDAQGQPVLLDRQDRTRWDPLLIHRGLAALARAEALAAQRGFYTLQAAIAACHARAVRAEDTDWPRIAALYAELARLRPSPVIELNRAVAVSRAEGAEAGLALLQPLLQEPSLRAYQWLPSVQAELLQQLGRRDEARDAWLRAAALAGNDAERQLLEARAEGLRHA
ncbi:RNA polymerase sigma factor [Ramlibacter rhizophilus]|uniref:RNA polymerase sigma factor n=1 Tax=Ramlibacter rhizophilus TaxID=1781167 RepID=A0A4Z0BEN9_9BURK|nr:RNA polymerase sigma factor [Ramlibacter rhizophilus]TFY97280.1 RNA polymerase sigma factor [Ramlibacter rhizophilus]